MGSQAGAGLAGEEARLGSVFWAGIGCVLDCVSPWYGTLGRLEVAGPT